MGKVKKNWANLDNTASTSKNEEETSESEDDLTQLFVYFTLTSMLI